MGLPWFIALRTCTLKYYNVFEVGVVRIQVIQLITFILITVSWSWNDGREADPCICHNRWMCKRTFVESVRVKKLMIFQACPVLDYMNQLPVHLVYSS